MKDRPPFGRAKSSNQTMAAVKKTKPILLSKKTQMKKILKDITSLHGSQAKNSFKKLMLKLKKENIATKVFGQRSRLLLMCSTLQLLNTYLMV